MLRNGRLGFLSLLVSVVAVACGARSELLVPEPPDRPDASVDVAPDVEDASPEADAVDDSPPDAVDASDADDQPVEADACSAPTQCEASDPSKIFQCGAVVQQCSTLEQCEEQGESGAACVNPCINTLGQNTSNGCEFYAAEMDLVPEGVGACFAVFVVNEWTTGEPAKLEVSRGGVVLPLDPFARIPVGTGVNITYGQFDSSVGLAQNGVAILFLSRDPAAESDPNPIAPRRLANCPPGVTPAVVGDAAQHGTGVGDAFRIKSNVPIVAYQMLPYGAGHARITGATLLYPTNVWGTNYVAVNAFGAPTSFMELRAGPTMAILGQADGTHVTINPVVDITAGGTLAGTAANTPVTYTVNRGQYLQFTQPEELTGSAIQSDQPVAVIGGATVMDVPIDQSRADGAEQMLPPVRALGSEYVAVRYRSRDPMAEEAVPWRLVGVVDGTQLTYEPAPPMGAPAVLNAHQLVEFTDPGPFVVRSQDAAHPFYMAAYMTGGQNFNGTGDPEFVNVISPRQYLSRYTFFTDPTYPETNLVVTRVLDPVSGLFPDVTLDCAGLLGGWSPVGTSGVYQFTRIDLSTGNFMGQNGCDNGVHTMTSALPGGVEGGASQSLFGVTIWGWGNDITWPTDNLGSDEANPLFTRWVSYAYPAGVNLAKLNDVVLPAQ